MSRAYTLILLLIVSLASQAQERTVRVLTMDDGMSCNYAVSLAKDKYGLMWVATDDGLCRYDGVRFIRLYKETSDLSSCDLNSILATPDGSALWVATKADGLNKMDLATGKVTTFRHDPNDDTTISSDEIANLSHAQDGGIWLATYRGGAVHMAPDSNTVTVFQTSNTPGMPSDNLWCVFELKDGRILTGHSNQGLCLIDPKTRRAKNFRHNDNDPESISGDDVMSIIADDWGRLWIGTNWGVDIFNLKKETFRHFRPDILTDRIFDIRQLSDGKIWIATEEHGVGIIDPDDEEENIRFISEGEQETDLSGLSCRAIEEDAFGNVWVALYAGGVNIIGHTNPAFTTKTPGYDKAKHIRKGQSVLCLGVAQDGTTWCGNDGDGLRLLDSTFDVIRQIPNQYGVYVQSMMTDPEGRMWLGTYDDGVRVVSTDGSAVKLDIPDKADIRQIVDDKHGGIWIATSFKGLFKVDSKTLEVTERHDLTGRPCRGLAIDHAGRLWIGFNCGGVMVYSADMQLLWTFDRSDKTLPNDNVNHIFCDSRGIVWVATNDGVVRFKMGKGGAPSSRHFGSSDGFANVHVRTIIEDTDGNIWCSTNNGLDCIRGGDGRVLSYNEKDNVPVANFNSCSGCRLPDGRLAFGGTSGVTVVRPADVLRTMLSPAPYFTTARLLAADADSLIDLTGMKGLTLKHDENTVALTFNTRDPAINPFIIYGYTIDGIQEHIIESSDGRVELRGLSPGIYTFHVRTRLHKQPWSTSEATFRLEILPPWWKTWWAYSLYIIIGLTCIVVALWLYRRRMKLRYELRISKMDRKLEERNYSERLRFFTNIAHELRTPLSLIVDPLDNMASATDIGIASRRKLAMIRLNALRLNTLFAQLREFIRTEVKSRELRVVEGNISEAVRKNVLKFQELIIRPSLEIKYESSISDLLILYDPEVLTIILDNLIYNSIKYTKRGAVTISTSLRDSEGKQWVDVTVADTGSGITPEALPHIFDRYYQADADNQGEGTGIGLAMVKSLAELHGATVNVESTVGVGTTFVISFDADATYPEAERIGQPSREEEEDEASDNAADTAPNDGSVAEEFANIIGAKPQMLVIHGNADVRDYIAEEFGKEFEVLTAPDGAMGLGLALTKAPEIILADLKAEQICGLDIARRLRQESATIHIPIVLLSDKESDDEKQECYDAGVDSYIASPFSTSLLRSRVMNLLERRKRDSEPEADSAAKDAANERIERLQTSLSQIDQEFLNRLNELIEKGIGGEVDVVSIATSMAMSPSNLYRKVKSMTGLSTVEYIRRYKMRYAEGLLLEGRYTIGEIAFMVGMNSTAYFRRCFKAEFGDIPSEYLKKLRARAAKE